MLPDVAWPAARSAALWAMGVLPKAKRPRWGPRGRWSQRETNQVLARGCREGPWSGQVGLSNLLSARSLLSKGASKMLRATGHAHMVTSNGISAEKLLGVAAHFHIQKLLKLRGCRFASGNRKIRRILNAQTISISIRN